MSGHLDVHDIAKNKRWFNVTYWYSHKVATLDLFNGMVQSKKSVRSRNPSSRTTEQFIFHIPAWMRVMNRW